MDKLAESRSCGASWIVLVAALGVWACGGSKAVLQDPDGVFGHRVDSTVEDDRETLVLAPEDTTGGFLIRPAPHDTVHVRTEPAEGTSDVRVELLVKGYLPDACSVLHDVRQIRSGNQIAVNLDMRRPEGMLCAAVVRPYRFYVRLDDTLAPGLYTLVFNQAEQAFQVE
jgi:hypothetical protein